MSINLATYVGTVQGNFLGALIATFAVVLPSFLIILLLAFILSKFNKNKYVKAFIKGAKPALTALLLATGLMLFMRAFGYSNEMQTFNFELRSVVVLVLLLFIYYVVYDRLKIKLQTMHVILITIVLGIICGPHF